MLVFNAICPSDLWHTARHTGGSSGSTVPLSQRLVCERVNGSNTALDSYGGRAAFKPAELHLDAPSATAVRYVSRNSSFDLQLQLIDAAGQLVTGETGFAGRLCPHCNHLTTSLMCAHRTG